MSIAASPPGRPTADDGAPCPGPGRPRSSQADAAILHATIELFADLGYEALTIEAVAEAAGVAKSTVYRRYPGKIDLIVAAIGELNTTISPAPEVLPDTGNIEDDAVALLMALRDKFASETKSRVIAALTAATARNPELAAAHATFIAGRRAYGMGLITRAVERGELPSSTDPEIIVDLLSATVYYRSFVSYGPLDDATIRAIVRAALPTDT